MEPSERMRRLRSEIRPEKSPEPCPVRPSRSVASGESGAAMLMVVATSIAVMGVAMMAPAMLRATAGAVGHNARKFQQLDETAQVRTFMAYPETCKRIIRDLIRIESLVDLRREDGHTFRRNSLTGSIRNKGSLRPASPSKDWTAPGPMQVLLGEPLFADRRIYRATLRVNKIVSEGTLTPRPEVVPLYVSFADNGLVEYCESTSVSSKDQLTFQDRVCQLHQTEPGLVLFDPVSRICRDADPAFVVTQMNSH